MLKVKKGAELEPSQAQAKVFSVRTVFDTTMDTVKNG